MHFSLCVRMLLFKGTLGSVNHRKYIPATTTSCIEMVQCREKIAQRKLQW